MNFGQKVTLYILLFFVLCSVAFSQVVEIPDPNLHAAIANTLGHTGDITSTHMRQLTELDVRDRNITTLTGLEFATNLTALIIAGNPITDLTPISTLTNLEALFMWHTPISDLTPLTRLTNLQTLNASSCQVADIRPLASLTQLTSLNLSRNHIVDIHPLANLSFLTDLELNKNNIVNVAPLVYLDQLRSLDIEHNQIADHRPLDALPLQHFVYDETCLMPPLPLNHRLERTYPSIFTAWGGLGWSTVLNQSHLTDLEQMSQHDLYFCCIIFDQRLFNAGTHWEVRGDSRTAIQLRDDYLTLNPHMIFLVTILLREARDNTFPQDSPYWVRDANGQRVNSHGDVLLVNFTHPDIQNIIVQQALAVSRCGLYDGIMFDWWHERDILNGYVDNNAQQHAKDNIISRIRANTPPNFLIMGNTNRRTIPRTAPYINGGFMETGVPGTATGSLLESLLTKVEASLLWLEQNLRQPHINSLEGWGIPSQPPNSPLNLRWMRAITTLSLTHSNGYVLYNNGTGHDHFWYDFWDANLGRPLGAKAQTYQGRDGLYIREYTNGWAVYNHSGTPQVIRLPEEVQGVASGLVNVEHALPNLDGEMYLRVTPKNPADVNGDGIVNILDLILVAQGFGADSTKGDINGDGVINVFDLVFVANEF